VSNPFLTMRNASVALTILAVAAFAGAVNARAEFSYFNEESKSGGSMSTDDKPKGWLTNVGKNWMSHLPDTTPLNKISIPGTHDSGAQCCGIAVRTQTWTITEQLNAGIRYFDIRTRRTGKSFAIHHGAVFVKRMFGDVMNEVTGFLSKNPKEVVLIRIKSDEHTAQNGSQSNSAIWASYKKRYGGYIYQGNNTLPTLGSARGKIVVLRNGIGTSSDGVSYSAADIQDKYKVYWLAHKMNDGEKVSLPSKKDVIKAQIRDAKTPKSGKLYLNHLSGAMGMTPKDVARATNGETYKYIAGRRGPLGVVIMDFPGDKLVYRIIKSNFRSSEFCSPKTFRTVSAKTWAEFRLPKKREGSTITVKGGAYNKYVFPKCNRVHWSDLTFYCDGKKGWKKTKGKWGSDALCHGSKGKSPYVAVGNR